MSPGFGNTYFTSGTSLTPEERRTVKTVFQIRLPFLLPRLKGNFFLEVDGETVGIAVRPENVPQGAAEQAISGKISATGITALDDHWGQLNFTRLKINFMKWIPIRSELIPIGEGKFKDDPPQEELTRKNLERVCRVANLLVDAHAVAAEWYFTRPIVPSDLIGWEGWYFNEKRVTVHG